MIGELLVDLLAAHDGIALLSAVTRELQSEQPLGFIGRILATFDDRSANITK